MESWIQVALTVFSSVLASSGLWTYLQRRNEQKQDEYENLRVYLYEPYAKLGGNGSAKRIMQEVDRLPIHKFVGKEDSQNDE